MRLRWAVVLLGGSIALAVAGPAWPLSQPHPQPAKQLSVRAFLKGRLGEDREVRLALIAAHPKGFFHLQTLAIALTLHGQSIQDLAFSVHDLTLTVGRNPAVPLTRETPPTSGSFLGVEPAKSHFVRSTFSGIGTCALRRLNSPRDSRCDTPNCKPSSGAVQRRSPPPP